MSSRSILLSTALLTSILLSGCRDAEIASYRVPKENVTPPARPADADNPHAGLGIPAPTKTSPAPAPSGDPMASTPVPTATGGDLTWTAPDTWQSRPASSMRKATYIIPGNSADEQAELAITAFPGDVGGNLANINRWRSQLKLAPITDAQLAETLTHLDVGSLHIDIVDLIGPDPTDGKPRQRMLGAIVPFNGSTWFFKLSGPDPLITTTKPDFLSFVQTIKAR